MRPGCAASRGERTLWSVPSCRRALGEAVGAWPAGEQNRRTRTSSRRAEQTAGKTRNSPAATTHFSGGGGEDYFRPDLFLFCRLL